MEAAAMGKPLIATNVPGCREVVENEKNGLLVRPRDSENLGNAMRMLISNEIRLQEYGKSSLMMSRHKIDFAGINNRIVNLYK